MNKPITDKLTDNEFKKYVSESNSLTELGLKMGFSGKPCGRALKRMRERMDELNISFNTKEKIVSTEKISQYKNSKEIGLIGEKAFEFLCAKNRLIFYKELSENQPHDYLLLINNKYYKVQVKTCEFIDDGSMKFTIRHGNYYHMTSEKIETKRRYKSDEVDLLFLYCIETNLSMLMKIDKEKDEVSSHISIRTEKPRNNQVKNCNFADDYIFEKIIKTLDSE